VTIPAIELTARALAYYVRREDVAAHNLANVSTDGFKAGRITAHSEASDHAPRAVGTLDMSQGGLRRTERALDLALEGPGFFVVSTPQGERLVRSGAFQLDASGRLSDGSGNAVLGDNGPIMSRGGALEVHEDGTVSSDGAVLDRLRIVVPRDASLLQQEGGGRFAAADLVEAPSTGTRVRSGSLEDANTETVSGLVDLISIQRAYSANIKTMQAMDDVLRITVNEIGRP
jgi:flagellar basal body rod protein FlgG